MVKHVKFPSIEQFRLQKENTNLSKSKYKFNLRYSNRTNGSLLSKYSQ